MVQGAAFPFIGEGAIDLEQGVYLLQHGLLGLIVTGAELLRALYLERPELYELDFSPDGFEWLLPDEADKNLVAFRRRSIAGKTLTVIVSFSGTEQTVRIRARKKGYVPLFVTADAGRLPEDAVRLERCKNLYYATVRVPPLSGMILIEPIHNTIEIRENENVL